MSYPTLHGTRCVLEPSPPERTFADTARVSTAGIERPEILDAVGFDAATPQPVSDSARGAL